jgi:hypothetical protein
MSRSALLFEGVQKKKNKLQEKYHKSGQLGYTSMGAFKCSDVSQSHHEHWMLPGGNCPTVIGSLFGRWTRW